MPKLSFEEAQEATVRNGDGIPSTGSQLHIPDVNSQISEAVTLGPQAAVLPTASQRTEDQSPTSWAGRYGQVILHAGIASIPTALYRYQSQLGLNIDQTWFVSAILAQKWDAGMPYPNLHAMTRYAGMDLRHLKRLRAELEAAEYLAVEPRFDPRTGAQQTSSYNFSGLFQRIELLLAASPGVPNPIESDVPPTALEGEETDNSFVARFGRVIVRSGIAAIPQALFTYQKVLQLRPAHIWFTSYILSYKWTAALPYPSLRKMADCTGYSLEHIHTLKEELVQRQYLKVIQRQNSAGGQTTSAYDFSGLFAAIIEQLQPPAPMTPPTVPPPPVNLQRVQRRRSTATSTLAMTTATTIRVSLDNPRDPASESSQNKVSLESERSSSLVSSYSDSSSYQLYTPPADQVDTPPSLKPVPLPDQVDTPLPVKSVPPPDPVGATNPDQVYTPPADQLCTPPADQACTPPLINSVPPPGPGRIEPMAGDLPDAPRLRAMTDDFTCEIERPLQRGPGALRQQIAANTTQTLTLWRTSGLAEDRFAELMYEARRLTQQAKGKQQMPGLRRPMAYFYTVLADLIAHSSNGATVAQPPASGVSQPLPKPPATARQVAGGRSFAFQFTNPQITTPVPDVLPASPPAASGTAAPTYSPYIASIILDYARELGACYQGPTHVTAALWLWQTSGLGETAFVAILHAARRQVRSTGPVNVMPQFFAVAEALLTQTSLTGAAEERV